MSNEESQAGSEKQQGIESQTQESPGDNPGSEKLINGVTRHVAKVAGIEQLEGFSLGDMFSEVFKKHSEDELEEHFTVGTKLTTPLIQEVDTSWPKPWVFFRTFVAAVIGYICFVQAWEQFQNLNLIPGLIIVGSFAIPLSTLIFFFETNVRKNVSLYQVIRLVFLGGILSLIFSLLLYQVSSLFSLSWLGASVAGIVEEPGKLIALLLVIYNPKYKYILNGLLFGAAIGTGFAAFESAGYALLAGLSSDADTMLNIIFQRGTLAPFGHIVWTGMSAAILWKIKGTQRFRTQMIKNPKFLRIFGIAITLHMIWNSPINLPFYGKYIICGFVAWFIILSLIQDGLKQLRVEKELATLMH
jgi:protease PrsW